MEMLAARMTPRNCTIRVASQPPGAALSSEGQTFSYSMIANGAISISITIISFVIIRTRPSVFWKSPCVRVATAHALWAHAHRSFFSLTFVNAPLSIFVRCLGATSYGTCVVARQLFPNLFTIWCNISTWYLQFAELRPKTSAQV